MIRQTKPLLVTAIVALCAAVFVVDLLLPLGVADGVLYVAPVALSLWLPGRRHTIHIGLACAALTALGFFLSPPGYELLSYSLLNRAYSWLAIGMVLLIDGLQGRLVRRNEELAAQAMRLETLYEIGTSLSALLDAGSVKAVAVQRARVLLAADAAGLALLDEASASVRWHYVLGAIGAGTANADPQSGQSLIGKVVRSGEPIIISDAQAEALGDDIAALRAVFGDAELRALLLVPVRLAGKPIGALVVGYGAARRFALDDVRLLSGLANQVAVAINNAQFVAQQNVLSALEERQRLAREMHDGMAQLLGGISARAIAAAELLDRGSVADAKGQLARLQEAAQLAYGDVRQAIWGLRTSATGPRDLGAALSDYVGRVNEREPIPVRLETAEGADTHRLSPAVEVQAIRIVQEAITNVQKHSGASAASIKIRGAAPWLTITIQDDGRGFDVNHPEDGGSHFGLQMMRERAESVGGHLEIESIPSKGTVLSLRLPMEDLTENAGQNHRSRRSSDL